MKHILSIITMMSIILLCGNSVHASWALFDDASDTVRINGNTVIGTEMTIEARILFSSEYSGTGTIFNEWQYGAEDKCLRAGINFISGYSWPSAPTYTALNTYPSLELGVAYHIAYVYDGTEERIYLNGKQRISRAASGNVGDSYSLPYIGAIYRDGAMSNSFIGYIDTLRVSDAAIYDEDFDPIQGDLTSDDNTLILFNFDEDEGSTTLTDLSGNGNNGVLGTGFYGATSPILNVSPVPEPQTIFLLFGGLIGLARYVRNKVSTI